MRARIYRPAKNAMTSGMAKTRKWVLDFVPSSAREVDPLMGWTSSSDTQSQVRLRFDTKEAALEYAEAHGIDAVVSEPKVRKANRRGPWTH
jgi:hypothetical protein